MDADGDEPTQLTFDDALKDQVPDWSPDGSKIAYAAGDPGDVLVMNADGSDQHTSSVDPTDDFGSAWSPDGGQIAFTPLRRSDGRYVANADGSNVHVVARSGCRPFRPGSREATGLHKTAARVTPRVGRAPHWTTLVRPFDAVPGVLEQQPGLRRREGFDDVGQMKWSVEPGVRAGVRPESNGPRSRLRGSFHVQGVGWRARIRTWNPLIQSQVLYR